jgi:hypothetical protein
MSLGPLILGAITGSTTILVLVLIRRRLRSRRLDRDSQEASGRLEALGFAPCSEEEIRSVAPHLSQSEGTALVSPTARREGGRPTFHYFARSTEHWVFPLDLPGNLPLILIYTDDEVPAERPTAPRYTGFRRPGDRRTKPMDVSAGTLSYWLAEAYGPEGLSITRFLGQALLQVLPEGGEFGIRLVDVRDGLATGQCKRLRPDDIERFWTWIGRLQAAVPTAIDGS